MFNLKEAERAITEKCAAGGKLPPAAAAGELMRSGALRVHGPEHHYLTAAVLCSAWYAQKREDIRPHLEKLAERCRMIPPAVCGCCGVCGVTMAAGTFFSEAFAVDYLSEESWRMLNLFTAKVQEAVALSGEQGPRCCKRSTFAALEAAEKTLKMLTGVSLGLESVSCGFSAQNDTCLKEKCRFYPGCAKQKG